jgi:5-methylcytosine-specific restriction protein A
MASLRYCLGCGKHYQPPGIRHRCPDCGREIDRRMSREKRARKARSSAAWQKARAMARQRDGDRCRQCGSTQGLEVHHLVPIAQGGDRFALSNLITLCSSCHHDSHRGVEATRPESRHTPAAVFREQIPGKITEPPLIG